MAAFDPSVHIRKVSGADYLEVKWRIAWLRDVHPNASVLTDLYAMTQDYAVFKCVATLDTGATATGWGSEERKDFKDYIEKAECVPLTVPILTRSGWKHYHQLTIGEDVLAYSCETDRLVWTKLLDVSTFPKTPVVRIGNSRFSAVCTNDHKWVLNGTLTPWDQHRTSQRITIAAPLAERGGDVADAARLGWLMTDCQVRYAGGLPSGATVQQSKPENFAALEWLFGPHTIEREVPDREWGNGRVSTTLAQRTWSIAAQDVRSMLGRFGVSSRRDLTQAVLSMTRDEAQAFLDAAMAADGSQGTSPTFGKTDLDVVEAVQLAAFLTGRATGTIKERSPNEMTTKPCYTVGIHKSGHKYVSEFTTTPLPPREVWCPTTEHGTWVANFNGFIGITGNTKAIGRALALLGFGTQFADDFADAPSGRIADAPVQRTQRPAPVPHTDLDGHALRAGIVSESKAREADRDAVKSPSWTAIYRPATAKGLNASDVQALARKRYGVERHDKLKADDMIDFADYISGTDAETLVAELAEAQ